MDLTLNELISYPLQLLETEVVEINAKKTQDLQEQEQLNIATKIKSEICNDKQGYSYIQIELKPLSEHFYLKIVVRGKFQSENPIKAEIFDRFLLVQGVKILWSYVREIIYDVSGKMLRNPFLLPTLDVAQTLANTNIQNKGNDDHEN